MKQLRWPLAVIGLVADRWSPHPLPVWAFSSLLSLALGYPWAQALLERMRGRGGK